MHIDISFPLLPDHFGTFELAYTSSLRKLASYSSRSFVRPDVFDQNDNWYRLIEVDGNWALVKVMKSGVVSWASSGVVQPSKIRHLTERILIPIILPSVAVQNLPPLLAKHFIEMSPLVHVASVTPGEAVIKAIIRQVITASQARKLLHRFIVQFGNTCTHEGVTHFSFPPLERLAQLPLDELTKCGLGFKARVIQQVARSLLEDNVEESVSKVPTQVALAILQKLKGVGQWTARVALCDFKGDWSLYPFGDLAVRTWTNRFWPDSDWPCSENEFRAVWERRNGNYADRIAFYLLTYGNLASVDKTYCDISAV